MPKNRAYRRAADNSLKAEKADEFKLEDHELKKLRKKKKVEDNYERTYAENLIQEEFHTNLRMCAL